MIILRNKEFSKTEKRDNSLRNAGIAAGIGVTGTGIALEKTRRDIKSKASKKVSDYKRRANNLLGEKINEVDKKAQTDIENVRKETKTKLDKGRRNYKETLQKTRPEIKKAKQRLAESSKKAGEGILSGKNTAEYGVNVKLPSGSRFDYHTKSGYVPNMTTADRMAEYKQY
jgi:adenylosuccinate synthase